MVSGVHTRFPHGGVILVVWSFLPLELGAVVISFDSKPRSLIHYSGPGFLLPPQPFVCVSGGFLFVPLT